MTNVMRKAYTEIDEVLKFFPQSYIDKIPKKILDTFKELKLENYKVNIDFNKPLEEQRLLRETVVLLAVLQYNFWCESSNEKEELKKMFQENERKKKDIYDISSLNNRAKNIEKTEINPNIQSSNTNLPAKVEKESLFSRIMSKIKSFFNKYKM